MARSNRARGASSTLSFFFIILSLVLLVPLTSARAPDAQPSPPVEGELICHTDNPAECYPKVFQATHEFQVIRDDQDIPNGLHIRMDMTTGRKEAKINVPDEENPALEGLPVDSSMIVVEPEEGESEDASPIPFAAPVYQAFGQVKPPKEESPQFYTHLDFIKKGPGGADLPFDEALEFLEEISHDMYYGDKIAENPETARVNALHSLLRSPVVRDDFLVSRGMDRLLEVLKPGGEKWAAGNEWEGAQRKVAHLLLDTFLEEEFGATKGIWPTFRAAETDAGKRRAARASDEQWIEAVRVIKDRHPGNKGHWSAGVLKQLETLHKAQLKNLPREDL
ncbi:Nucleotide exchange factor SIL1 like protein [Verticillium longisporum]|nr:Nucleotide exchange factor SIL1 like protein [Verticillium longisporum]